MTWTGGYRCDERSGRRRPRPGGLPRRGAGVLRSTLRSSVIPRPTTSARTSSLGPRMVTRPSSTGLANCNASSPPPASPACTFPPSTAAEGSATPMPQVIEQELRRYDAPSLRPLGIGMHLAVATLLASGSEAQKRRYLPALISADEQWCQLFSEPDAGSDLVSLRTPGRPRRRRMGGRRAEGVVVVRRQRPFRTVARPHRPGCPEAPRRHHDVRPPDGRRRGSRFVRSSTSPAGCTSTRSSSKGCDSVPTP